MPKFDLLLLPLLGGYIFLTNFNFTKYYHQRIERQRLVFNSLILAFFLSVLGLLIDEYILKFFPDIRSFLGFLVPINYDGIKQSILIFGISYPLAKLLNLIINNKWMFGQVVKIWGDEYEKLFWDSLQYKNDADKLLIVTTSTNKVYVGYVNRISEPINSSHITLIPNFSGYRDKNTQEFMVTTNYISVLEHFVREDQEELIDSKMGILIPRSEIVLVSRFSYDIFIRFQELDAVSDEDDLDDSQKL